MQNECEHQVDSWKSKLILEIARRKGFLSHELNDAQQQVYLSLMNFKYDSVRAGGGSERAVIALLIEKKLTQIQRTQLRARKHTEKIRRVCGPSKFQPFTDDRHLDHERRFELVIDINTVMKRLNDLEREICKALSSGECPLQISKRMCLSRTKVSEIIDRIRDQFISLGLDSN